MPQKTVEMMIDGIDRLLVVDLAGKRLAMDVSTVTEVSELPETWPIPLAPDFFKGVINSHGSLIPLLDLAFYLGEEAGLSGGKTLILDRRLADLALWVDDVERVIPSFEVTFLRSGEAPALAVLEIDGSEVTLISPKLLVDMVEADLQLLMQEQFATLEERA